MHDAHHPSSMSDRRTPPHAYSPVRHCYPENMFQVPIASPLGLLAMDLNN